MNHTELQPFSEFLLAHDIWVVQNSNRPYTTHTKLQSVSDFWPFPQVQPVQGACMDPNKVKIEVHKILDLDPPEIQASGTPGRSHGTQIFVSKFSSYNPLMMLFYAFCGFVVVKIANFKENL